LPSTERSHRFTVKAREQPWASGRGLDPCSPVPCPWCVRPLLYFEPHVKSREPIQYPARMRCGSASSSLSPRMVVGAGAAPRLVDACRCFVPAVCRAAGRLQWRQRRASSSQFTPRPSRTRWIEASDAADRPVSSGIITKDAPLSTRRLAREWRLLFRCGSDEQITEDFVTWDWDSLHAELQTPRVHPTIFTLECQAPKRSKRWEISTRYRGRRCP
jgi:hypothetical protein